VIVAEDKPPEGVIKGAQRQCRCAMGLARRGIARQVGQEALVDRLKEALHPSSPTGFAGQRKDQPDFEIGADLLDMPGREITAVIGIQDRRNAADGPARFALAPDGLRQRQRCLERRRGVEREKIPSDGTAVIIHNDGEPRAVRETLGVQHQNIEQRVIGLPDGVGGVDFTPV
jgi:hypothetical protein